MGCRLSPLPSLGLGLMIHKPRVLELPEPQRMVLSRVLAALMGCNSQASPGSWRTYSYL